MGLDAMSASDGLQKRLELEAFIADCAVRFAGLKESESLEDAIGDALTELVIVAHADGAALLGGTPEGGGQAWVTSAARGAALPFDHTDFAASFPWQFHALCASRRPVVLDSLDDLPPEAETDRRSAAASGVRSMMAVPVDDREGGTHCLIIHSAHRQRAWPSPYADRLQALARVFVDALSRRRALETQRQVEAGQADLLESVRAIVWRADARTFQTRFVSNEAEAILGYPLESWSRVPGFWLDHIHPDDREWVIALSSSATRQRRKHDFEYRMIVADGRTVWLRNIVNVLAEDGEPTELVGVTVDVTERKLAEFEAARLRDQLTTALRVASLGELAVMLAHELNQPLGAIVSNAEAAQVFLGQVPPALERVQGILADIAHDGQRAGAVVHRVRKVLQKQSIEIRPLDVERVVNEVAGLTRALALARRIELTIDVAPGLPAPSGDAVQIEQVLLNLIFNAIDAAADRPEGLRQVWIRATGCGGSVEFSVTDTGSGIAPEMLPNVFDPFFTTKAGGMGMGLAICRTIVRSHGGDISVENNAGGGATVRFRLPAQDGGEDPGTGSAGR